jgi:hypothetical protein
MSLLHKLPNKRSHEKKPIKIMANKIRPSKTSDTGFIFKNKGKDGKYE